MFAYGTITVNSPGVVNVITPAHMHISVCVLSSVGMFASSTFGTPATHGAGVAGMHGIGVSTPSAADVAAATVGFAMLVQAPNGIMFTIGMWSMMLAANCPLIVVRLTGSTESTEGAIPIVHMSCADMMVA